MGKLVRTGILRSTKGAHGGVVLARGPEEITLLSSDRLSRGGAPVLLSSGHERT